MQAVDSKNPAQMQYQKFSIDQIKTSRSQARKDFDETALIGLAQSMKEKGLIQAITLRLLPDGSAELVSGERRVRAAKRLGWTEIEAKVFPALSNQDAAVKGLIENLQWEDLNPVEKAQGYSRLAEEFKLSHVAIAKKLGIQNNENISRMIVLLEMPKEVQHLVAEGSLTERHTRSLRQFTDPGQQIRLG